MVVTTYLFNTIIKSPAVPGETPYRIPLRVVGGNEIDSLTPGPATPEEVISPEALALAEAKALAEAAKREEEEAQRRLIEQMKAEAAGLLKEAETARQTASGLLKQARLDADAIREEARNKAKEEGIQIAAEAKADGFAQGHREGIAKAEAEGETIRAIAQDVLRQAEESRLETLQSIEESVMELSLEIAEKMIAAQLTLAPETVTNIAKEALSLLENRALIVLYVNPAELPLYESNIDELRSLLPLRAELQLITDASVGTGGCRIETESGTVDATLETRRNAILAALYGE